MQRRQSISGAWLIIDQRIDREILRKVRKLPRGSGLLVLGKPVSSELLRVRRLAALNDLTMIVEGRGRAIRVHNLRELRTALLQRTPLLLLSPVHATSSHPDWKPIPRMRAASLARLAGRQLFALGGMNARRHAAIAPLGFVGWAGISAFRT